MKRGLLSQLRISVLIGMTLVASQCSTKQTALPKDLLGLAIGMDKAAAQKRLEEIAIFDRDEQKRQQLWKLKNDLRFNYVAVGYDERDQVRYVTALVDNDVAKERIAFADVGDLSLAKREIVEPHYRYIWTVPANGENNAYSLNVYGDNPQFVTIYTMDKVLGPGDSEEKENESE